MKTVNVHKAKTELSKLLTEVEAGGEVVIARGNKPVARLVAVEAPEGARKPPVPGALAHLREAMKDVDGFTHSPEEYVNREEDLDRYFRSNPRYDLVTRQSPGFAEDDHLDLDGLPEAIGSGKEFTIMRDGKAVATVAPLNDGGKRVRGFGMLAHLPPVPDAVFFDPLPEEELRAWEGERSFDPDKRDP